MLFQSRATAIQSVYVLVKKKIDFMQIGWLLFEGNHVASSECNIGRTAKYIWSKLISPSINKTYRSLFDVSCLSFFLNWFYFSCLPFGGETMFVDYGGEK